MKWINTTTVNPKDFTCGYCGIPISSEKAFLHDWGGNNRPAIYICSRCKKPNFFDMSGTQTPGAVYGNSVKDIPEESVRLLYEEARRCTGCNSFTGAVFCCRKLLMNIAVSKGAEIGKSFFNYVEYLSNNHYIPPDAKEWVDHIRDKGNEATHEIAIMNKEDAEYLLSFMEMLLKIIYEFPSAVKKKSAKKETDDNPETLPSERRPIIL